MVYYLQWWLSWICLGETIGYHEPPLRFLIGHALPTERDPVYWESTVVLNRAGDRTQGTRIAWPETHRWWCVLIIELLEGGKKKPSHNLERFIVSGKKHCSCLEQSVDCIWPNGTAWKLLVNITVRKNHCSSDRGRGLVFWEANYTNYTWLRGLSEYCMPQTKYT